MLHTCCVCSCAAGRQACIVKQCMHDKLVAACREEGLKGLWKGIGPNVARNAIVNAAELASYDQVMFSSLA